MIKYIDRLLNLGQQPDDDINKIRLIRQVNGLNIFYTFVAISVGIISFTILRKSRGTFYLGVVQVFASIFYFSNIILTLKKKLNISRRLTIHVFEWHLFLVAFLTNAWYSPVLLAAVLYPLLAALVEVSIFKHFFIGLFQLCIFLVIHFLFPNFEKTILNLSGITADISLILRIMGLVYFPIMGAVIMKIIFRENLRARIAQKKMLNEISITNRQLEIYSERLRDESMRLQAEVNIAKKMQSMVLPSFDESDKIEDLDISFIMRPADEVGGDYYDVIKIDDYIIFGIGDVTGHGLSSGIIMLMAQTAIRTVSELKITKIQDFLKLVNSVLYSNIKRLNVDRNMTLAIILYKKRKFIISGQHESVIICRKDGKIEVYDTFNLGFYIGLVPEITDQVDSISVKLNTDDIMFLYSDGVTEAVNENKEQFGIDRICSSLSRYRKMPSKKIKYKIIQQLYNFMGSSEIYDDISFIVIKQK